MVDVAVPATAGNGANSGGTETRARLIESACEVFLENGYARTRVQDIAKRAGLTTGAMYAHFENKAALLSEAIAQYGDRAMGEVVDSLDHHQPGAMGVAIGVDLLSGPTLPFHRLILEALAVSARGEETADLIGPALDRMGQRIRTRVEEALQAGLIQGDISSDALVAMFQRMVLGSIVAKAVELPAVDARAGEHLVATFLAALVPPE